MGLERRKLGRQGSALPPGSVAGPRYDAERMATVDR